MLADGQAVLVADVEVREVRRGKEALRDVERVGVGALRFDLIDVHRVAVVVVERAKRRDVHEHAVRRHVRRDDALALALAKHHASGRARIDRARELERDRRQRRRGLTLRRGVHVHEVELAAVVLAALRGVLPIRELMPARHWLFRGLLHPAGGGQRDGADRARAEEEFPARM